MQFLRPSAVEVNNEQNKIRLIKLAEDLRPHTKRAMKIEVAPWIKDYVTEMDLYCDLTLEKIEDKPFGVLEIALKHYRDIFQKTGKNHGCYFKSPKSRIPVAVKNIKKVCSKEMQVEPIKKILIRGDPGVGKTTLIKKIAWDWGSGIFTRFTIIFVILLKFVPPNESIENVIMKQTPELEGLGVKPTTLRKIIEEFGSDCLVILDGLDEHSLGRNEDIVKVIRGQKWLPCTLIVTSRPHTTRDVEKYFETIVKIDGFTRVQANKFARKILDNESKIKDVLEFNPGQYRDDSPLHNLPILLSFMCLLVKEDHIDLGDKTITKGEIYFRMVRCLYKKYVIRKDKEYSEKEFSNSLRSVGKLALDTLVSQNPLLQ